MVASAVVVREKTTCLGDWLLEPGSAAKPFPATMNRDVNKPAKNVIRFICPPTTTFTPAAGLDNGEFTSPRVAPTIEASLKSARQTHDTTARPLCLRSEPSARQ